MDIQLTQTKEKRLKIEVERKKLNEQLINKQEKNTNKKYI